MQRVVLVLAMALGWVTSANGQVSFGLAVRQPGLSIGINFSSYPNLVLVPGYPVYYDPRADANYFFYDGLYWVYVDDNWYASSWYNGPWEAVDIYYVPEFLLRVPVRYYRRPPVYFRGWRADAPPRWDEHWGREWSARRRGWDHWDRRAMPPPAPLPTYQRQYSGDRYPRAFEQQNAIRGDRYPYQPHARQQPEWRGHPMQQQQPWQQSRAGGRENLPAQQEKARQQDAAAAQGGRDARHREHDRDHR